MASNSFSLYAGDASRWIGGAVLQGCLRGRLGSPSTIRSRIEGNNLAPMYLGFFLCLDHQVCRVT